MNTPLTDSERDRLRSRCDQLIESQRLSDAAFHEQFARAEELRACLQNLVDEQNGAPLERRREQWQATMDEARAALDAIEDSK